MAKFTIFSKDGNSIRYVGEPQYSGSYMSVDFVEFRTISSSKPISWQIGDYVDYHRTGLRYKLYSLPQPKKVARRGEYGAAFEYSNVQFYAATKELEIAPFRDLVPEDNNIHFSTRPDVSTYEDVYGVARRIQECMDDLYPNRWRIEVYDTDDADLLALFGETKEYSVSGGSCLDALSQIYDVWKSVGWIHTYDSASDTDIITIGRANVRDEENTSDAFAYGMGNGLTSIKKASANEGEFATRLYVYGSERNIQTRYYNEKDILNKDSVDIRNLMLPIEKWGKTNGLPDARKAYLQADDAIVEKYGLIPRTIYFDGSQNEEIYPSITGITEGKVRAEMIALGNGNSPLLPPDTNERLDKVVGCSHPYDKGNKEDIEANPTFLLATRQLGFNLYEQGKLTEGGSAVISMKSGDCAGREFVVKSFDGSFRYPNVVLERSWDDSLGMGFPNGIYRILPDDEFVILEIPMPEFYISLAEDRLFAAGQKMLADYTRVSAFYEPGIDAIEIHEGAKVLRAGMYMQVYDKDIIDTESNTDYVLIDSITIDEKSELPTYRVTLREQKRAARSFSALEDMIEDAKESAKKETDRARQYTDRRFRSAQETLSMLEGAFKNFSEGVNPVTVRTMALLVGDESLQFKFTASAESLDDIPCPLTWDNATKQMKATESVLIHMTLGVDEVTTKGAREAEDYKHWTIPAQDLDVIDDTKARYVYARVPMDGTTATDAYVLSETYIVMDAEEGFHHLLVGILNSEYNGSRDFVTLYGFTEVLPGQITTDVIRSADGKTVLDLVNGVLNFGDRVGLSSNGNENVNLRMWAGSASSAKEDAPFKVYDDGSVLASLLTLLNGCRIGEGIWIEDDAIVINTPHINGQIHISEYGIQCIGSSSASMGNCAGAAIQGFGEGVAAFCPTEKKSIGVHAEAKDGDYAFYSKIGGVFGGLRTATKTVASSEEASPIELTSVDFNIYYPFTSGTCHILLPKDPLDGQEYWFESRGGNFNISANGHNIWSTGGLINGIIFSGAARMKYYAGAEWTFVKIEQV